MCTTRVYTNDPVLGGSDLLAATDGGNAGANERKMKITIVIWEQ